MHERHPNIPRRSTRLQGYDYRQPGAYFVTLCTEGRYALFGEIKGEAMTLSEWGWLVREEWLKSGQVRPYVRVVDEELVVMPNHLHGILWIVPDGDEARHRRAATADSAPRVSEADQPRFGNPVAGSLSTIIGAFKSVTTRLINVQRGTPGAPVWQRNFYEHVVRSEEELNRVRKYILENPARWAFDRENPVATQPDTVDPWL